MQNPAPSLLPIFRSQHQARLLATVLLQPGRDHTVTGLARELGMPISTLHREVQRLVEAGILSDRAVGRARLISPGTDARVLGPLTDLLLATYGPVPVVREEFSLIENIELVLIYGSWAARYQGQPGSPPNDLDVLVVGSPNRGAVYDAAERAGRRLGIVVSPVISSPSRWSQALDGLIQQIRTSPFEVVVDRTQS